MEEAKEGFLPQKAAGDEAFRAGELEQALSHYTEALEAEPCHVPTLCNRSLAALKLGHPEEALQDAEAALAALSQPGCTAPAGQLAKAVHRKAEALAALGQLLECLRAYRQGLAASPGSPELHAALRMAAEELPVPWLAKYWARHVEAAQQPNLLSSRDGRLIKPVPAEQRLAPADLEAHLQAALYPLQDEARDLLCAAWALAQRPGRAECAYMRGVAYLSAGNAQQAFKDARVALVYGPQLADAPPAGASTADLPPGTTGPPAAEAAGAFSAWPAALALLSGALEGMADNVPAALAIQRAFELEPENEGHAVARERLMRRIPEACMAALQSGGAAGLAIHLAVLRDEAMPEFRKQRPKYYYYYEWMKKRIYGQYPQLPEPVMDKLLALEANELDMILQYPRATQITVERLVGVYESQGPEELETYTVPLLSWEDYQSIKKDAPLALPAGDSSAPALEGRLLEGGSMDPAGANSGTPQGGDTDASAAGSGIEGGQGQLPVAARLAECGAVGRQGAGGMASGKSAPAKGVAAVGGCGPAAAGPGTPDMEDAASEAGSVDVAEAGEEEEDELFELD